MKMHDQQGNIVTQFFAWFASISAVLGITTQDLAYILFGLIGVMVSIASYVSGRIDARNAQKEDRKRTQLLNEYLQGIQKKPIDERPSSADVITKAMNRINNDGATD